MDFVHVWKVVNINCVHACVEGDEYVPIFGKQCRILSICGCQRRIFVDIWEVMKDIAPFVGGSARYFPLLHVSVRDPETNNNCHQLSIFPFNNKKEE